MFMKKTIFSWFVILYFIYGIWSNVTTLTLMFMYSNPFQDMSKFLFSPIVILFVIDIVVFLIYLYKLFRFNKDVILWTNLTFGYSGLRSILMIVLFGKNTDLVTEVLGLVILYVIWRFFSEHLKKKFSSNTTPVTV